MKKLLIIFLFFPLAGFSQQPDGDELGAWYMYFFQRKPTSGRFGFQGDFQFRFWRPASDLEQLLLRSGVTYNPSQTNLLLTAGYAYILTGVPGEGGENISEHRIYQEALLPNTFGRLLFTHRFRYEQRFVENQDFRTRFRYNLFLNIPFNSKTLEKGTWYFAGYNELFINGERNIGNGREVELFDRVRSYLGLGYALKQNLRLQGGWMRQETDSWTKGQLQVSVHQSF
jgi:hypothetical protein